MFKTTDVFLSNRNADTDIIINQGGTSSGKTYSILQNLYLHAIENERCIITVAGQDIPNLKVGPIRDAHNIVENTEGLSNYILEYNKSDRVFTFVKNLL
jgi:phage terminase large subunit